jgi:hypothetical protein
MANLLSQIFSTGYAGFNNLTPVKGNVPFGYYDSDPMFVADAQNCAAFVAQRLGVGGAQNTNLYITDLTVYAAFEEAVTTYGNLVYQYKIRDNYINMEGTPTLPFINNAVTMVTEYTLPQYLPNNIADIPTRGVYWSNSRNATWADIGFNSVFSRSIADGSVYVISASIGDFINPDIKFIKSFTFAQSFNSPTYGTVNLSTVVYNQFNKLAGPTSQSIDPNTNNIINTITSGSSHIYFFTNDSSVNGANATLFPRDTINPYYSPIPTVYYQNNLEPALNGKLLNNNLTTITSRIADSYAMEAGVGGSVPVEKGHITLIPGVQDYDLNSWAAASASLAPGDTIEIRRIFYEAPPAITRYFDPYAGTGTGAQSLLETFGFGSYSPGINFLLMPAYWDVLKIQAIEFNDQIRKSSYSFELTNNVLRIFPVPTNIGKRPQLWFEYVKMSDKNNITTDTRDNVVTDVMNVPYRNPIYTNINQPGRTWIFKYTLAICKEIEGQIRVQYSNVSLPYIGAPNGTELITDARAEKTDLITELKEMLNEVSRKGQLERKQQETQFTRDTLSQIPLPIYIL